MGIVREGHTVTFAGPEVILGGPYTVDVHTPRNVPSPAAFELLHKGEVIGRTDASFGKGILVGVDCITLTPR